MTFLRNLSCQTFLVGVSLGFITLLSACAWFSKSEAGKVIVVNVLDKELHQDCHIKGSINVPFGDLKDYALRHWNKEHDRLVIYCANYKCTASGEGAKILKELGFQHVWAYEAGIAEWKQKGYPVDGPCTQEYLNAANEKPEHIPADVSVITTEELHKMLQESPHKCC